MNGLFLLDKPSGLSSSQCVYKIRKRLNISKIGHCGTLDPLATGILPICIGEATKYSQYLTDDTKEYEVVIGLGIKTDTGDREGKIIKRDNKEFSEKALHQVLKKFTGTYFQTPPMFSALKYKGKPMYYWARKGVYLFRKDRKLNIEYIKLLSLSKESITLKIACSKGCYIRSLAEDICESIGTLGTVINLHRTRVGPFLGCQKVDLEKLCKESLKGHLIPVEEIFSGLYEVKINQLDLKKIINGQSIDYNAPKYKKGIVKIYTDEGRFIGLGNLDFNKIYPKRLLSSISQESS
tara:strand:- start:73042 stop:73923 length:882 start_codon:yes stop_codon:yes gene_type:complete